MKRKKRLYATVAATGLCALGGTMAWADQPAPTHSKRGIVHQVDQQQNTFSLGKRSGKPTGTFVWDGTTVFTEQGMEVTAGELKPGDHALVRYLTYQGEQIATEVRLHSNCS